MTLCSGEILRWLWGRMGGRSDGGGGGAALEHAADPWPSSSSGCRARTASLLSVARWGSFWPRTVQPLAAAVPRALTPRAAGAAGCRVPAAFRCQMLAAESWIGADADCGSATAWMKGLDGMVPWSVSAREFLRDGVEEEAHREMAALVEAGRGGKEQILEEQATAASCAGAGDAYGPGAQVRCREPESGMRTLCRAGGDSFQELVAEAAWKRGRSKALFARNSGLELSEADSLRELPGEGGLSSFGESRRPLSFMFAFGKDAFACSVKTSVSYGCKTEWKVRVFVLPAPASDAVAKHGRPGVCPVRKCSIPCGEQVDCVLCRIYRKEPRLTWESVEYPCHTVVERTSSSGSECGVAFLEVFASSPENEFPVLVAPAPDHGHPGFCPRSMCNPGDHGGEHVECAPCRIYRKLRLTWEAAGAGYSGHAVSESIPLSGSDCGVDLLERVECGPRPSGLVCETKGERSTPPSIRFTGDPVRGGDVSFSCSKTGGACVQVVPCTSQVSNSLVARFVGGGNETVSELVCTGRIAPPPFRLYIQVSSVEKSACMPKFPFYLIPRLEFSWDLSLPTRLQGQAAAFQMAIDGGVRIESWREVRRLALRSPSLRPYNSLDKLAGEGEKDGSGLLGSDNLLLECESQAAHRMNMLIILSEAAEVQERGPPSEAWGNVFPECLSQATSETYVETTSYAALQGELAQTKSDAANSRRSSVVQHSVVLVLVSGPVNMTLMREYIEGWLWYGAYQMSMETLVPEAAGTEVEQQSLWPDSGNLSPECLSQATSESVPGTVAREKKTAKTEVMGLTFEGDCRSTIEMYADTGRGSSGGQGAGSVDELINLKSVPKHCRNKQGKVQTLGWVVRIAVAVVAQRKKAMKTNRLSVRNRGMESQEIRTLTGGRANDWLNVSPVSFLWVSGAKAKLASLWSTFFPTSRSGASPAPALSGGELVTGPITGGAAWESDFLPKIRHLCLVPAKSVPDSPAHGRMRKHRHPVALSRQPTSHKPTNTGQCERRKAALTAVLRYKRILTFLEPFQLPALHTLKTRRFNC